jgi:serine/threonine protein kinase
MISRIPLDAGWRDAYVRWFLWTYGWVRRDPKRCQAGAFAAMQALHDGATVEQASKLAKRHRSRGAAQRELALADPWKRVYGDWVAWARAQVGTDLEACRRVADLGLQATLDGAEPAEAARLAMLTVLSPEQLEAEAEARHLQRREWREGDVIRDRYEVERVITKGGMGLVYFVFDRNLGQASAIKTYRDQVFAHEEVQANFVREATAWINLDAHPNIVRAELVEVVNDKPLLVMEYVAGGDLGEWIGTPRLTRDLAEVLRLCIQFCDGMNHALAKGIACHRDIKPANCLLTAGGDLKISDFGLAIVMAQKRRFGGGSRAPEERRGALGTWAFMAPEQWDEAALVDVQADVYSFGVMLFEMVTGDLPFLPAGRLPTWELARRLRDLHLKAPPPSIRGRTQLAWSRELAAVDELIQDCLGKRPIDRPMGFTEIRASLAQLYESLTDTSAPIALSGAMLDADDWLNKGVSLVRLGRAAEAATAYKRALELNSALSLAWWDLALANESLGHREAADYAWRRYLRLQPGDLDGIVRRGNNLLVNQKWRRAFKVFEVAVKSAPDNTDAWIGSGIALVKLGEGIRWRPSAVSLVTIGAPIALAANVVMLVVLAISITVARPRRRQALARFDRALSLDPSSSEGWRGRGDALDLLGDFPGAVASYRRAIELDAANTLAWFNLGITYFKRSHFTDALPAFQVANQLGWGGAAQMIQQCQRKGA